MSNSRRFQDWPRRLSDFIETRREQGFAWGANDCCLFACDAIFAQTGIDPAAPVFRGKYDNALAAHRLLAEHGGVERIAERTTEAHGFPELPTVNLAQRGDLVLVDAPTGGAALGVCLGALAAFPGPLELSLIPTGLCRRAWRVA